MDIKALQRPLRDAYEADPDSAQLTLTVRSAPSDLADPLHCAITPDSAPDAVWRSGAHPAVGGVGDVPCSGDLLLAALAACQEVTLRMVAANQGVELLDVQVKVEGDWDPRGTLAMGREFPVGLTAIRCKTSVRVGADVDEQRTARLLKSAERYCVVLNTLRAGMDVRSEFSLTT
ncbi:MAG: OsmC family protein [Actinomycetota bacterium]